MGCTGLYGAVLGCTRPYWAVLGCAGLYWAVLNGSQKMYVLFGLNHRLPEKMCDVTPVTEH